ncbi:MAG: hypothetical protein JXL67_11895, partial [Calditrichaeota bacterium]|nr:hypothetical protein [Calditrichota bacterium]
MKILLKIFLSLLLLMPYEMAYSLNKEAGEVRNIIFLIGDGMGIGQISVFRVQKTGAFGELAVDKMPVTGLMKVH